MFKRNKTQDYNKLPNYQVIFPHVYIYNNKWKSYHDKKFINKL